jgi:hypothetical protein
MTTERLENSNKELC